MSEERLAERFVDYKDVDRWLEAELRVVQFGKPVSDVPFHLREAENRFEAAVAWAKSHEDPHGSVRISRWELAAEVMHNQNLGEGRGEFLDRVLVVAEGDWEERRQAYFWLRGDHFLLASSETQRRWREIMSADLAIVPVDYEGHSLRASILDNGHADWARGGIYRQVRDIVLEEPLGITDQFYGEQLGAIRTARLVMGRLMASRLQGDVEGFLQDSDARLWDEVVEVGYVHPELMHGLVVVGLTQGWAKREGEWLWGKWVGIARNYISELLSEYEDRWEENPGAAMSIYAHNAGPLREIFGLARRSTKKRSQRKLWDEAVDEFINFDPSPALGRELVEAALGDFDGLRWYYSQK